MFRHGARLVVALVMWVVPALSAAAQDKPRLEPGIEVVSQIGHKENITSVAFSPDGRHVISASIDRTLKLWEVASGRKVRTFSHKNQVNAAAFAPDGRHVISDSLGEPLKMWEVATGREILPAPPYLQRPTKRVVFSRDGQYVVAVGEATLTLWEVATAKEVRTFSGQQPMPDITAVAFSDDGRYLVSASNQTIAEGRTAATANNQVIRLWEAATGRELRAFPALTGRVYVLVWSPDGGHFTSVSDERTPIDARRFKHETVVKLWELNSSRVVRSVKDPENGYFRALSADGRRAISSTGSTSNDTALRLWEADTGRLIRIFPDRAVTAAFSRDGRYLVSASRTGRADGIEGLLREEYRMDLHDLDSKQPALAFSDRVFADKVVTVRSIAASPDRRHIVSVNGRSAWLWDLVTGRPVRTFDGHAKSVTAAVFTIDGRQLITASEDLTLKLWEVATGQVLRTFSDHGQAVTSVALLSSGQMISGSADQTLKLWEIDTARVLHTFTGQDRITSIALSPDGQHMISGSGENAAFKLWIIAGRREVGSLELNPFHAVVYLPDGQHIISSSYDGVPFSVDLATWENTKGKDGRAFKGTHNGPILAIALSPSGQQLVTGGFDQTLKLWEVDTGREVRTFRGHEGGVTSVAFSPDGKRLFSGSLDGTTRVWDAETSELLVSLVSGRDGAWLALTPSGFFDASDNGLDMLAVVRGLDMYAVEQFRDQLQRRDIVRDRLTGDVLKSYAEATRKLDLQKILDSGPLPTLQVLDDQIERAGDTVRIKIRLFNNTDKGGIGPRLIWRVNGQTQGETDPAVLKGRATNGEPVIVESSLRLDPTRENIVTVTAYNGAGLLATLPLAYQIDRFGETPVGQARPRMHIIAVGVNGYSDPALPALQLAVNDVTALGHSLKLAAEAGGYEQATIVPLLEADARRDKIAAAFAEVAGRAARQDTLIVVLAGHGKSVDGRYHYMPFDARFGGGRNIMTEGITGQTWQQWIASVQVGKKLVVIDTCDSASGIGFVRSSGDAVVARESAVEHLQRGLGESVITAAREAALESSRLQHGILTYAILEALATPAPEIDVWTIAAYVVKAVPRLSEELSGKSQEPLNKITGNFSLGVPQPSTAPARPVADPTVPGRYVLVSDQPVAVRSRPDPTAPVNSTLPAYTVVQVFEFAPSGWALIGLGGNKLGYVTADIVKKLNE